MSFILLMIAFLLTGGIGVTNKALVEWDLAAYRDLYMLAFYGTAMVLGAMITFVRQETNKPDDRWVGLLMGLSGALSMLFLLIALEHMPGIVVFPVRNLGNLVLTAGVSIIAWREELSRSQKVGIALSLIAIWLIY